jgi:hypothetical protein
LGPREIPNLWAFVELSTLQDQLFASANPAATGQTVEMVEADGVMASRVQLLLEPRL